MKYRPGQMKTAEGMVEFSAPQVRDTPEPFVSAIRENLAGRTQALEDLAVELYARGQYEVGIRQSRFMSTRP
jgi:putative transposase